MMTQRERIGGDYYITVHYITAKHEDVVEWLLL